MSEIVSPHPQTWPPDLEIERLRQMLEWKLRRRRELNSPLEVRAFRRSGAPPPQAISVSFRDAEAILALLAPPAVGIRPQPQEKKTDTLSRVDGK